MTVATEPPMEIAGLPVTKRIHSHVLESALAARRAGVMLHYDDSSSDVWAVEWFRDPHCKNGYTWLVLDDGRVVELANPARRTPHAGVCRTPMANSKYYGVAAATNGHVPTTASQFDAIVQICVALFKHHGWEASTVITRIVGHDAEAIWSPESTRAAGLPDEQGRALWGKLGRKIDPTGRRSDGTPIVDVAKVRERVRAQLLAEEVPDASN